MISLGTPKKISLSEAKTEAKKCLVLLSRGVDPKDARDQLAKTHESDVQPITFADFWEKAFDDYVSIRRIKPLTAKTYRGQVRNHLLPSLGSIPLEAMTPTIVADAIRPIWTARPTTGVSTRMILEQLFMIAVRDGLMATNPAVWRGNLALFLPPLAKIHVVKNREALTVDQLRESMPRLLTAQGVGPRAAAFIALAATRLKEALLAKRSEVTDDGKTLIIPPERRKDGKPYPHRVPLSDQARRILETFDHQHEFFFESRYCRGVTVTNAAVLAALRTAAKSETATVHGCRSTFSSWCAENRVDAEVREACLMHSMGTASARAYQRSDLLEQRRDVMQRWADAILPMCALEAALEERS